MQHYPSYDVAPYILQKAGELLLEMSPDVLAATRSGSEAHAEIYPPRSRTPLSRKNSHGQHAFDPLLRDVSLVLRAFCLQLQVSRSRWNHRFSSLDQNGCSEI